MQGIRLRCAEVWWYIGKRLPRLRGDGPKPAGQRHCQLPDEGHDWSRPLHEDLNPVSEISVTSSSVNHVRTWTLIDYRAILRLAICWLTVTSRFVHSEIQIV